jgi:hypothetical protein
MVAAAKKSKKVSPASLTRIAITPSETRRMSVLELSRPKVAGAMGDVNKMARVALQV